MYFFPDDFTHILPLSQYLDGGDDLLHEYDLQISLVEAAGQMGPYFLDADVIDVSFEDGVTFL